MSARRRRFVLLLALTVAGRGGRRAETDVKLGEFIPPSPPQPAPRGRLHRHRRQTGQSRRFRAASRSSSICGRPGASPACRRCRRSSGCRRSSADRLTVAGGFAGPRRRQGGRRRSSPSSGSTRSEDLSRPEERRSARPSRCAGCRPASCSTREGRCVGRVEGAAEWDSDKMLAVLEPLLRRSADAARSRRQRGRAAEHLAQEAAAALQPLRVDRVLDARGRPASRPARRRPSSAASACAIELERHQRVVGAVDQQHRRARAQFAGQQLGRDQPARNSRECRPAALRGAARQTATSSCPARTRPAPHRHRSGRASAIPRR